MTRRWGLVWTKGGAASVLLASTPVAADVRSGVEAWGSGDFDRAVAEWRAPADRGDPDALFNLAQAYRLGRGVPTDVKKAEALYARAAAKGHSKAADNYGLLLFQDGRRDAAMPYVTSAAERGDPRAQYLLGIAHFNGDMVARDWVKAYALLTLANGAGLPQASAAIRQMDDHVPLPQRQQAQALAATMRTSADSNRSSRLAAEDLGTGPADAAAAPARAALPPARLPKPVARADVPPSIGMAAPRTGAAPTQATKTGTPPAMQPLEQRALGKVAAKLAQASTAAAAAPAAGPWRVQLGAFSVAANADRAWSQAAGHCVLAGKHKQAVSASGLTRLFARGWATEGEARTACAALKASGQSCLVVR